MDLISLHENLSSSLPGKGLLWTLSMFYRAGVALREAAYTSKTIKSRSVRARVVCIGNITTGGRGKPTACLLAATELSKAHVKTAIVSRGYRGSVDTEEAYVINEDAPEDVWQITGDEPFLMHKALKKHKVPVIVCPDRYKAAHAAVLKFQSEVVLLDDGFQHFALDRDMNILLIDARNPFGGDHLLPLGTLREPKTALERAGLMVITHADLVETERIDDIIAEIRDYNESAPILQAVHEPEHYFDVCRNEMVPLSKIKGKAAAISGIGDPASFEKTLEHQGLKLEQAWRYPDHHPFTLEQLKSAHAVLNGLPLITTYKDFTRFPDGWREIFTEGLYVLSIHMKISGGKEQNDIFMDALYPSSSRP